VIALSIRETEHESPTSRYDEAVHRSGLSETHRYLLKHVPERSTVLEIGPSSGYMTKLLAERGCTVDAVEVDPSDAAKAAVYCRTMVVGSVEDGSLLSRVPGPYDVLLMADVLEHLRSPGQVLQTLRRRLSPVGFGLASLPNIAHWRMRLSLLFGRFEYTETDLLDRTHLRFYTRKTAQQLFIDAGYAVEKIVIPPPPPSRYRILHDIMRDSFPTLFSVNFIYHVRPLEL
jgi:2-polyprenyl-3-methyl-5-hydroxy-6-metoxy-1,4-benzoquinol methylase